MERGDRNAILFNVNTVLEGVGRSHLAKGVLGHCVGVCDSGGLAFG